MKRIPLKDLYPTQLQGKEKWQCRLWNTAKLVVITILAILLTEMLYRLHISGQSLILVYMLAVLIISCVTPGYVYGIVSAVISPLAYDILLTEPRGGLRLTIASPITLLTMLIATIITSTLVVQIREQGRLALVRERRAEVLYDINQLLLAARDLHSIVQLTREELFGHLERPAVFYTQNPVTNPEEAQLDGVDAIFLQPAEQKRVHRIFQRGGEEELESEEQAVCYIPVMLADRMLGIFGIYCGGQPLSPGETTFVQMLSAQVAMAMELQLRSDEQSRTLVDAEREKMRSTLLRAISHDLRTPLTSILGASSTILEQEGMERDTAHDLIRDVQENAQWLIRMVENVLTITKISKETMKVTKTLEAAEEVVSQTVSIVRGRFPDCTIHVRIPDELLMVPMDATLISQVLINLMENSIRNSPERGLILLDLKKQDNFARFDVSDSGKGIPEYLLDNLFEGGQPHPEQAADSTRGMGIGLSICKAIVQAHGGQIGGLNRPEGGAKFWFLLPLSEGGQV